MNLRNRFFPARALLFALSALVLGPPCGVNAEGQRISKYHQSRPCGPDFLPGPLRFLLFQGCAGADFRPICRRHDACYEVPGSNQLICDRIMLGELKAASRNSKRPLHALYRAHIAYIGVRAGGWISWRAEQKEYKRSGSACGR